MAVWLVGLRSREIGWVSGWLADWLASWLAGCVADMHPKQTLTTRIHPYSIYEEPRYRGPSACVTNKDSPGIELPGRYGEP